MGWIFGLELVYELDDEFADLGAELGFGDEFFEFREECLPGVFGACVKWMRTEDFTDDFDSGNCEECVIRFFMT